MIALTFDDGPSIWTESVLDVLARHEAWATFFVCGSNIRGHERALLRMREEGHEIGNHTWSHWPLDELSDFSVRGELETTSGLIEAITGEAPRWWRAPHLRRTETIEMIATSLGMTHVGFTLDSLDYSSGATQVVQLAQQLLTSNSILDMHDGHPPGKPGDRSHVAPAVHQIINHFDSLHSFVTVGELRGVTA